MEGSRSIIEKILKASRATIKFLRQKIMTKHPGHMLLAGSDTAETQKLWGTHSSSLWGYRELVIQAGLVEETEGGGRRKKPRFWATFTQHYPTLASSLSSFSLL